MKKSKQDKIKVKEIETDQEADKTIVNRADNLLADWLISLYFKKRGVDSKDFGLYNHHRNKELNNYASPSGCLRTKIDG